MENTNDDLFISRDKTTSIKITHVGSESRKPGRARCDHRNLLNDTETGILKCMFCGYQMTRTDFNRWLGIHSPVELVGREQGSRNYSSGNGSDLRFQNS